MKKLLVILVAICLAFAAFVGCTGGNTAPATATPEPTAEATINPADISVPTLDYDAIHALHAPEDVVMLVGDEQITWDEYYSWIRMTASQVESFFQNAAASGTTLAWTDNMDETSTYADYVPLSVEASLAQLVAINKAAEELGYVKDAEFEATLKEQREGDIVTMCGEGATEEEFFSKLAENNMSRETYNRMSEANALYTAAFESIYGADFEKLAEEDILKYLTDNSYMYATHILFMTVDPSTGEALDDAAKAEKLAAAEDVYKQLSEITDSEELVKKFAELKEQYCEDSGKATYPNGYVFTPGTMVAEFENATLALGDYEICEPVETSYGYHIIMRLPLDTEAVMGYSSSGSPYNARVLYADQEYNGAIETNLSALEVTYPDGMEAIDVTKFIK